MTNAQYSFKLIFYHVIFLIFYTFLVNRQNTFSQPIFVQYKCLVSIQTCSRTIVDLKLTHLE